MADNKETSTIGPKTVVGITLDQVVRVVVVIAMFLIGWLYRGQEALRDDLKRVGEKFDTNAEERRVLSTKLEVVDKVGAVKLDNLDKKLDLLGRAVDKIGDDRKRSGP